MKNNNTQTFISPESYQVKVQSELNGLSRSVPAESIVTAAGLPRTSAASLKLLMEFGAIPWEPGDLKAWAPVISGTNYYYPVRVL